MANLKKNLFYQTLYQILATAFPLITTPYVSRVLGSHNIGTYTYVATIANYFVVFSMLGITNYGTKTIAGNKIDSNSLGKAYCGIRKMQCVITSIIFALYVCFVVVIIDENRILYIIESLWILNCYIDVNWFFFGLEQFELTVKRNLIIKLITLVGLFIFVRTKNDLLMYAFILAISTVLSNVYLMTQVKNNRFTKVDVSIKDSFSHFKPMMLLFVPILAMTFYHQMDKTMLGMFSTYEEVGYYGNSDKIINILLGIISGLGTVSLPAIVSLISKGKIDEYRNIVEKSVELVMMGCSAIAFGMLSISKEFVPVFFGPGFDSCVNLISLLSFVIFFKGITTIIVNQVLIPNNKEKEYIIAVFIGAGINFFANIILIQLYGGIGAAIATIIAEAVVCIIEVVLIRKIIPFVLYVRKNVMYVVFGLGMYLAVKIMSPILKFRIFVNLCLEIVIGGSFFLLCCMIYWKITKSPIYEIFSSKISRFHLNKN